MDNYILLALCHKKWIDEGKGGRTLDTPYLCALLIRNLVLTKYEIKSALHLHPVMRASTVDAYSLHELSEISSWWQRHKKTSSGLFLTTNARKWVETLTLIFKIYHMQQQRIRDIVMLIKIMNQMLTAEHPLLSFCMWLTHPPIVSPASWCCRDLLAPNCLTHACCLLSRSDQRAVSSLQSI